MKRTSFLSYYVSSLVRVVRSPLRSITFFFAIALHSLAHAVLALAAGAVAALLVRPGAWGPSPLFSASPLDIAWLGLTAAIVKGGAGTYVSHVQARIAGDAATELREEILYDLLATYWARAGHVDHSGGATRDAQSVAALTDRVRDVESGMSRGVLATIRAVAQLLPVIAGLVALVPRLAALSLAVLLPFGMLLSVCRRSWRRQNERLAARTTDLLGAADEAVKHADLWLVAGAERAVSRHLTSIGNELSKRSATLEASGSALSSVNEVLGAFAVVLVVGLALHSSFGVHVDGGELLLFVLLFFLAYRPLRDLAEARLVMTRASAAFELLRTFEGRKRGTMPTLPLDDVARPQWRAAHLTLDGLTLPHTDLPPLSLTISPGAFVVVLGPTGVGKTTLLRVLLGLEEASAGRVLFGDRDITAAPPGPLARPFAWLPQDAPLLATTLDGNLDLAGDGTDGRAWMRRLGATPLLLSLGTARLGTGERSLSGGERQTVALARALASDSPVLLLDEPTSAMDAGTAARVLSVLIARPRTQTLILVTHRTELADHADLVLRVGAPHVITRPHAREREEASRPGVDAALPG